MDEPLWGTQGGGLAKWDEIKQRYVFVEFPDWWKDHEDNVVPSEWGVIPANDEALEEMRRHELGEYY